MTPTPFVFGQDTERLIATTGWIGADPTTGADVAFLLVYPTGGDIAEKMRRLAQAYGLIPVLEGEMPRVPADTVHATLDGEPVVRIVPGESVLHRPVPSDWARTARQRGEIVLAVGERIFRPDRRRPVRAIDKYVEDGRGLHAGLITVS